MLRTGLSFSEISTRSDQAFSVEDGKNGIELLANVYFSRKPANLGEIDTKESTFTVNRSPDGRISIAQFVDGYLAAHAEIVEHFVNVDFAEKQMVSTDVSVSSVTDNAVEFRITTNVGESLPMSHPSRDCQDYFAAGEEFYSGAVSGQNGPCDGSDLNSSENGTTKLEGAANQLFLEAAEQSAPADIHSLEFAGFVMINGQTDLQDELFVGFDYPYPNAEATNMDGYRDFKLWSNTFDPDFNDCIESEDMNFYLCNMFSLATYSSNRPSGRLPVYAQLYFDLGLTCDCGQSTSHDMEVFYGIPMYVDNGSGGGYTNPDEVLMSDMIDVIFNPVP